MTAAELIERLSKLAPETPLYVNGYEGGVCDLTTVEEVKVRRDVNDEWYYGNHETIEDWHDPLPEGEEAQAGALIS